MQLELKPSRCGRRTLAPTLALVLSLAVAAGGFAFSTSARAKTPPIDAPCQEVAAVLSDGPDPGADPVGYAEAQIIQLRKLKLPDAKLEKAVRHLASAYQAYVEADGKSKGARAAVRKAAKAVNTICPAAGATL
jgi:hypothetical protein